ncbi:hypothetical protein ABTB34_20935, partial [Acinetobacter baumannii]
MARKRRSDHSQLSFLDELASARPLPVGKRLADAQEGDDREQVRRDGAGPLAPLSAKGVGGPGE